VVLSHHDPLVWTIGVAMPSKSSIGADHDGYLGRTFTDQVTLRGCSGVERERLRDLVRMQATGEEKSQQHARLVRV